MEMIHGNFGPPLSIFLFILRAGASVRGVKKVFPPPPKKKCFDAIYYVSRGVGIFLTKKKIQIHFFSCFLNDLQPKKREKSNKNGEKTFFNDLCFKKMRCLTKHYFDMHREGNIQ